MQHDALGKLLLEVKWFALSWPSVFVAELLSFRFHLELQMEDHNRTVVISSAYKEPAAGFILTTERFLYGTNASAKHTVQLVDFYFICEPACKNEMTILLLRTKYCKS